MPSNANASSTSAGKLHVLDLADMKAQMGERWTRVADSMEGFFEGAVRRNLGPGDTFMRKGELSYILLFRDLSAEEAQVKCRAISEEVCERLFGDQIKRVSLRTLVVSLKQESWSGDSISAGLDDLLERKGRESIVRLAASKGSTPDAAPDAPGAAGEENRAKDAQTFLYRPIWDATKNVVITYLCQSIDTAAATAGSKTPEDRQVKTDRGVLQECAMRTQQLHRSRLRILSGVTVHLDTLSYSRFWAQYLKDLQAVPADVSRDFAFFVIGIDSGVPNIRLAQELPKLTRFSHQVFCIISDRGYVGTRFSRTGAHAIGIILSPGESESIAMSRIAELAQQASDAGLAAFVLGVPSTSLMLHALGQGIRYLEGPVIRPAVNDPRHAFAQSLEYVYTTAKSGPAPAPARA